VNPGDAGLVRVTLYNVQDNFRYLKSDMDTLDESGCVTSEVTCLSFCNVDPNAGDPKSWGRTTLEYYNQIKAERMRPAWLPPRPEPASGPQRASVTVLAVGTAGGDVRLWDYVANKHLFLERPDLAQPPPVLSVGFTTDGRCLAALYGHSALRMWSFSPERPRLPKLDRELLQTKLRAEVDQRLLADALEQRLAGRRRAKADLEEEQAREYASIAEYVKGVKDVLPPPTIAALGHPNAFLTLKPPRDRFERRTMLTMAVVPGLARPSAFQTSESSFSFADEYPPAYPGCALPTPDVVKMYERLLRGSDCRALFLVNRAELETQEVVNLEGLDAATLGVGERRKLEQLLREQQRKAAEERAREEQLEQEAAAETARLLAEAMGGDAVDDDIGLDFFQEQGPRTAAPAARIRPLDALAVSSEQVVLGVDVRIEYLEPFAYPPEAAVQVRTYNIERYKFIRQFRRGAAPAAPEAELGPVADEPAEDAPPAPDADGLFADVPHEWRHPRTRAVLAARRFLDDPDPRYQEEHRLMASRGAQPQARRYDLLGSLLVRDDKREYTFPLASLVQLQRGKFSVEHLSPAAARDPFECSVTLVGTEDQLHLVAPTPEVADEWVHAIRYIFWRCGCNLGPAERAPQFLRECVPEDPALLDVDLVDALNASVSLGLWRLMSSKTRRGERKPGDARLRQHEEEGASDSEDEAATAGDDDFYFGLDVLDNIFATTCHTYRIFAGGINFAGLLQVRVNHAAVYEHYCLDNKDPELVPAASSAAYTAALIAAGLSKRDRDRGGVTMFSMPALELGPTQPLPTVEEADLLRLLSLAQGQHAARDLGDYTWLSAGCRSSTPHVRHCAASADGRCVVTADVAIEQGPEEEGEEALTEAEELAELNSPLQGRGEDEAGADGEEEEEEAGGAAERERALHDKPRRYRVSVWAVAGGALSAHVVGEHDLLVPAVGVVPPALARRVWAPRARTQEDEDEEEGALRRPDEEDDPASDAEEQARAPGDSSSRAAYLVASCSHDETVRVWRYADGAGHTSAAAVGDELQVVERPHFLRLLIGAPRLAQQGRGAQDQEDDGPAAAGRAAKLISDTQQRYQALLEERRKRAHFAAARGKVYKSATLSRATVATALPAGAQMKQLDKLLTMNKEK
jgi:hypothetical protein